MLEWGPVVDVSRGLLRVELTEGGRDVLTHAGRCAEVRFYTGVATSVPTATARSRSYGPYEREAELSRKR